MSEDVVDALATAIQVIAARHALRAAALAEGFADVGVTAAGEFVVHCDEPGYRRIARLAGTASRLVGCYVQVFSDTDPAARVTTVPL